MVLLMRELDDVLAYWLSCQFHKTFSSHVALTFFDVLNFETDHACARLMETLELAALHFL